MARIAGGSPLYRIAKKCEMPGDNAFWKCVNFFFCQAMILYGAQIYKGLKKKFPEKKLCLFPTNSMGDAVVYGRFENYFLQYIGKREDETVLVCSDYLAGSLQTVGIKDIYPLSIRKIAPLVMANHFYGEDKIDLSAITGALIFDYESILDKSLKPCLLRFEFDSDKIQQDLLDAGCTPGRTVVLSPYENSMSQWGEQIPISEFWVELSEALKAAGFDVCTNCAGGEKEPPVEGTAKVYPKLSEAQEFIAQAGAAVVIRSGFTDYAAMTDGALITLYSSESYWKLFKLSGDKAIHGHHEIIYKGSVDDDGYRKTLISQIVGFIKDEKIDGRI